MNSFKKVSKKSMRKRNYSSGSEDDSEKEDVVSNVVQDLKEIQKLRKRQQCVSAEDLAATKTEKKEEKVEDDPFKMKTGGYIDMKKMKLKRMRATQEELEAVSGTSFAAETNCRDEDADMVKYVEDELARRKGLAQDEQEDEPRKLGRNRFTERIKTSIDYQTRSRRDIFEDKDFTKELYELPDHIRAIEGTTKKKNENMLSNQMLSGIPEVDLGIEAKIKNIEQTEEAKLKLMKDRMNKKKENTTFVPTNMAVNFVQHNRFNIEDSGPAPKRPEPVKKVEPVRVGDIRGTNNTDSIKSRQNKGEKATDDFHYEKFKKQVRRY